MIFLTLGKLKRLDTDLQDGCAFLRWFKETYGVITTVSAICRRFQNPEWNDWGRKEFPDHLVWLLSQEIRLTRACIKRGVDVNTVDKFGSTALHCAIRYRRTGLVRCLLKKRAKWNVVDNNGKTPLSLAKLFLRNKATKLLKERGAIY